VNREYTSDLPINVKKRKKRDRQRMKERKPKS
jgi:hypothetical protein